MEECPICGNDAVEDEHFICPDCRRENDLEWDAWDACNRSRNT